MSRGGTAAEGTPLPAHSQQHNSIVIVLLCAYGTKHLVGRAAVPSEAAVVLCEKVGRCGCNHACQVLAV